MEYLVLVGALFLSTTALLSLKKLSPSPAPIRVQKNTKQDTWK